MPNNKPVTRSQTALQGEGGPTKQEEVTGVDTQVQHDGGGPILHDPRDATGQTQSIDNVAVLDAVQSLGKELQNYCERVNVIESKLSQLQVSQSPSSSADQSADGRNEGHVAGATLHGHADIENQAPPAAVAHNFPKPGEFDGSGSWVSFIAQFRVIASAQRWNESAKLAMLVASLKGPALELFAHLPDADRTDFSRLSSALEGRFGAANQEPWFRSQLRRRRRKPGETLPQLAREIERLVSLAYPAATMVLRDSLSCDHFLDALDDADLHIAVRQGHPTSLPQALASAVEIESIRGAAGLPPHSSSPGAVARQGRGPRASGSRDVGESKENGETADVLTKIWRTLNDLQRSLAQSARGGGSRWSTATGRQPMGPCWECGREGHFRRQCPHLKNQTGSTPAREQGNE